MIPWAGVKVVGLGPDESDVSTIAVTASPVGPGSAS
jgi:hypothetical protein